MSSSELSVVFLFLVLFCQSDLLSSASDATISQDEHFNCWENCASTAKTCTEATPANDFKDGIYLLSVAQNDSKPFYVSCIHENPKERAWTIVQRRKDGSINFNRNWLDYKRGFGDLNGEYWIGLERLNAMTNTEPHELWVVIKDLNGKGSFAKYSKFSIANEDAGYKLTLGEYTGNIGDSFRKHDGSKFSTFDKDHDKLRTVNCAERYKGGWWYTNCSECNLNGDGPSEMINKNIPDPLSGVTWLMYPPEIPIGYVHMAIRPL